MSFGCQINTPRDCLSVCKRWSVVIELFSLVLRLAGKVHTELAEGGDVNLREDDSGVYLGVTELGDRLKGAAGICITDRGNGESDEHLVGVETGVVVTEVLGLKPLDGLKYLGRDDLYPIVNARYGLEGVEESGAGCAEKRRGLACDYSAVVQLYGYGGGGGELRLGKGRSYTASVRLGAGELTHKELDLAELYLAAASLADIAENTVVSADYLLLCGVADGFIVIDTEARHIYTHIRGGLVGALAEDALEHRAKNGKYLNVSVVVYGGSTVGVEVEGVDHIDVVKVGCRRLVGEVDGVI